MAEAAPGVTYSRSVGQYRSYIRLPDGAHVTVVGRRAGYPLRESYGRMFVPASLDLLYEVFRWLRYRTVLWSAWTIDVVEDRITGGPDDPTVIESFSADNRKAASLGVACLTRLLPSKGLDALRDPELAPLGIRPLPAGLTSSDDDSWSDE